VLHYDDTAAALRFLVEAFGFRAAVAAGDGDGDVLHAEMRRPAGGAVVFGSTKHVGGVHGQMRARTGACYGVDAVFERAVAAHAEIVERPHETAFGTGVPTPAFIARDLKGNVWTFGTYRGAP
jgi:uncharacterized glyoxalase superfamily protein PhnB